METQFIFYCDYINSFYICFNKELEETPKKSQKFKTETEFIQNIKTLKTLDLKLTGFLLHVRDYFKWMLLLIIATDIVIIVIDIYWIYGGFIYGDNPYFLRENFFLLVINQFVHFYILFSFQNLA